MTPKYIYFARSIRGGHSNGDSLINELVINAIHDAGHLWQFDLIDVRPDTKSDLDIYRRDVNQMDRCQAMIAEVSNPSLGVGYEIAYAKHVRKMPILCVCISGRKVSAMITGAMKVQEYTTSESITKLVRDFLEFAEVLAR